MSQLSLEKYGFIKLNHTMQTVEFYELKNHASITEEPDFTRINIYLCMDSNFVNIWHGFVESLFVESALEKKGLTISKELDVDEAYTTKLFRGYIENDSELEVILKTTRINEFSPSILTGDGQNRLCCQSLN